MTAEDIIRRLNLRPLQREGGYYRETYRSETILPRIALTPELKTNKSLSTAIYYLLTPDTFSAIHRLPFDEIYHFYLGDPVRLLILNPGGSSEVITLGPDLAEEHQVQMVVPKNRWQGSRLAAGGRWALMGTTVAPGFDFTDYQAGIREKLLAEYPSQADLIVGLTRS
nr:cupin domain-containing protein [candidate division Zixibacteria bacterium]